MDDDSTRIDAAGQRIMDDAREGLASNEKAARQSFDNWVRAGRGVVWCRQEAMRRTHNRGGKWGWHQNMAIKKIYEEEHFLADDKLHKALRSQLADLMENLPAIEAWRATLDAEDLVKWAYPKTVLQHWRAYAAKQAEEARIKAGGPAPAAKPSPYASIRDNLIQQTERADEAERKVLKLQAELKATPTQQQDFESQKRIEQLERALAAAQDENTRLTEQLQQQEPEPAQATLEPLVEFTIDQDRAAHLKAALERLGIRTQEQLKTPRDITELDQTAQLLRVSWRKANNYFTSFARTFIETCDLIDTGIYGAKQFAGRTVPWNSGSWMLNKAGLSKALTTKMLSQFERTLAGEHRERLAAERAQQRKVKQAAAAQKKPKAAAKPRVERMKLEPDTIEAPAEAVEE